MTEIKIESTVDIYKILYIYIYIITEYIYIYNILLMSTVDSIFISVIFRINNIIMQAPVEIGLSNASPVWHRRKNVTEQNKNLPFARI